MPVRGTTSIQLKSSPVLVQQMSRVTRFFNQKVMKSNKDIAFKHMRKTPSPNLEFYQKNWLLTSSIFNDVKLEGFEKVALVGPCSHFLVSEVFLRRAPKQLTICDHSEQSLRFTMQAMKDSGTMRMLELNAVKVQQRIIGQKWDFDQESLNLVISSMHLHNANNMESTLGDILKTLNPDGCLIGTTLGPDNLEELRISMTLAENERYGGVSPHVSPYINLPEMGNILHRSGFKITTISRNKQELRLQDPLELMNYIKFLGQNSSLFGRRKGCFKNLFYAFVAIYDSTFKDPDGIYVTKDTISFIGWKHSQSQKQPLKRGSQQLTFEDWIKELEKVDGAKIKHGVIDEDDLVDPPQSNNSKDK